MLGKPAKHANIQSMLIRRRPPASQPTPSPAGLRRQLPGWPAAAAEKVGRPPPPQPASPPRAGAPRPAMGKNISKEKMGEYGDPPSKTPSAALGTPAAPILPARLACVASVNSERNKQHPRKLS
eukprot:gene2899-biopygen5274